MQRFAHFLTHNNLIPITLSVVLLGAGSTYASQNPERIYATENRIVAIDNTYLVNIDLEDYTPTTRITDVTEDEGAFYVTYDLSTIALVDAVWQDTTKTRTLTVHKETLADHRDLGAFVTTQLRDVIERELTQLQKTQGYERKQVSQKQITTSHSGLVGTFMDDKTETLPPYTKEEEPDPVPPPSNPPVTPAPDKTVEGESESQNTPPSIALLGEPTITVSIGEAYTDLGVHVMDREDEVVDTTITVDGEAVELVTLDTSEADTYRIVYTAVDQDGATASVTRTVVVEDEVTTGSGSGGTTGADQDTGTTTNETATSTSTEQGSAASTTAPTTDNDDDAATTTESDPVTSTSTTTSTDTASTTDTSGGNDAATTSTATNDSASNTATSTSNETADGDNVTDDATTNTDTGTSSELAAGIGEDSESTTDTSNTNDGDTEADTTTTSTDATTSASSTTQGDE